MYLYLERKTVSMKKDRLFKKLINFHQIRMNAFVKMLLSRGWLSISKGSPALCMLTLGKELIHTTMYMPPMQENPSLSCWEPLPTTMINISYSG